MELRKYIWYGNMQKLNQIVFLLFLFMFFYQSLSASEVSYTEALERLYGTHESMAQAESDYKEKQYLKKAALGLYSPRFSINGVYTYFGNDLAMDVDLTHVKNGINGVLGGLFCCPLSLTQSVHLPSDNIITHNRVNVNIKIKTI